MFVIGKQGEVKRTNHVNILTKGVAIAVFGLAPHGQQFINQSILAPNHLVIISSLFWFASDYWQRVSHIIQSGSQPPGQSETVSLSVSHPNHSDGHAVIQLVSQKVSQWVSALVSTTVSQSVIPGVSQSVNQSFSTQSNYTLSRLLVGQSV